MEISSAEFALSRSDNLRLILALSLSEWSVLYVTIASFMIVVAIATFVWGMVCCCRG